MEEVSLMLFPPSRNVLRISRALLAKPPERPSTEEVREQVQIHRKQASEEILRMRQDEKERQSPSRR